MSREKYVDSYRALPLRTRSHVWNRQGGLRDPVPDGSYSFCICGPPRTPVCRQEGRTRHNAPAAGTSRSYRTGEVTLLSGTRIHSLIIIIVVIAVLIRIV